MSDAWSHKVRLKKIMKGRHFLCVVQRHGETTVTPGHNGPNYGQRIGKGGVSKT